MQNITLSADEALIAAARQRAAAENTTLNAQFGPWLSAFSIAKPEADFDALMHDLQKRIVITRKYTRDEMNER